MKKVTLLSLVLILLAVSVVPVMAASGPPNGHGNGVGAGQGNNGGDKNQTKQQDRDRSKLRDRDRINNSGLGKTKNQEDTWMHTPFYLQGTISAIDPGAKTITVTLIHANAKVKQFLGTDLVLHTNDGTLIFQITQGGDDTEATSSTEPTDDDSGNRIPITFDQLVVGNKVAIHGRLLEDLYTARLITEYLQAPPE
ncbi:MAG: hypothetical protein A2030_02120 [Chloroflexi bacterium RBG_19FT_COMBO_50_10]|nr:MAG: hypothetical protein A2030_02120 [Chloroflexi bacterium RBG_19FT_COMBO_50_10]